jgi:hypothetical protein
MAKDTKHWVNPSTGPCGRVGYLSKKLAKEAARKLPGRGLTAYRCEDERCVGMPWHLTEASTGERQVYRENRRRNREGDEAT